VNGKVALNRWNRGCCICGDEYNLMDVSVGFGFMAYVFIGRRQNVECTT
jgi:hypothetical protein